MTSQKSVRVGAVSYLNTRPLVYRLGELAPQAEIAFDLPSRLADRLREGSLDVALIPTSEFFGDPGYAFISDACIACRGPVLSVKLLCRRPLEQVRSVALDEGSRTSAVLVRILLDQRCRQTPTYQPLPIGADLRDTSADAILLIGDRAIHSPAGPFAEEWDLGEWWWRWTKLPFVFALWTARAQTELRGVASALSQSRDLGLAHLNEIANVEAPAVGLTQPQCLAYLQNNLHFVFGPREQLGLQRFYDLARQLDLAPAGWELFHNRQTTKPSPVKM